MPRVTLLHMNSFSLCRSTDLSNGMGPLSVFFLSIVLIGPCILVEEMDLGMSDRFALMHMSKLCVASVALALLHRSSGIVLVRETFVS